MLLQENREFIWIEYSLQPSISIKNNKTAQPHSLVDIFI